MKINGFVPDSKIFDNIKAVGSDSGTQDNSFISLLKSKLNEVNDQQINADNETESFIQGDGPDVHEVMLSTEEAKMSLDLAVQVRNKLVDAYQELNRTQL